ncbi:DUF2510 domain-containing protein, partial [Streptomyces alkaliterrae]|uniref:DUF2510 domain-containing protein n=1 Tax=Streptomyces alkaliterrae TaxID=2213162 RepID=UPI003F68D732
MTVSIVGILSPGRVSHRWREDRSRIITRVSQEFLAPLFGRRPERPRARRTARRGGAARAVARCGAAYPAAVGSGSRDSGRPEDTADRAPGGGILVDVDPAAVMRWHPAAKHTLWPSRYGTGLMSAPPSGSANGSTTAGYYPDPSIPGYIRYWDGSAWVPGTSRPAPAAGEPMPEPPPGVAAAAPTPPGPAAPPLTPPGPAAPPPGPVTGPSGGDTAEPADAIPPATPPGPDRSPDASSATSPTTPAGAGAGGT